MIVGQEGNITVEFGTKYNWKSGFKASQLIYSGSYLVGIKITKEMINAARLKERVANEEIVFNITLLARLTASLQEQQIVLEQSVDNLKKMEKELDNLISYERIVPVEVYKVSLDSFLNVTNEIGKFVPQTVVPIISEAQGKVTALYVKTGDFVKKGQVLAEIDKEVISSQLTTAKTNMDNAEREMNRLKILSEGDVVTKQ